MLTVVFSFARLGGVGGGRALALPKFATKVNQSKRTCQPVSPDREFLGNSLGFLFSVVFLGPHCLAYQVAGLITLPFFDRDVGIYSV